MSNAIDAEVNAIKSVLDALSPLSPEARSSVLDYVLKRLGIAALSANQASLSAGSAPFVGETFGNLTEGAPSAVVHIEDLKAEKKPRSANEMAALVAYYLGNVAPEDKRKKSVNVKDIETYFKIAKFPLPQQIKMTLPNAKNAGYFDSAGEGEYRLNPVGYNLVAHSMPRGVSSVKGKAKKAKSPARKKTKSKKR